MSLTSYIHSRGGRCDHCNASIGPDARALLDTKTDRAYCSRSCGAADVEDQRLEAIAAEYDELHECDRFEVY